MRFLPASLAKISTRGTPARITAATAVLVAILAGLLPIAMIHYLTATAILLFMLSHIYLGTTGKTVGQMFKMMFTGWHEH